MFKERNVAKELREGGTLQIFLLQKNENNTAKSVYVSFMAQGSSSFFNGNTNLMVSPNPQLYITFNLAIKYKTQKQCN